jgi:hypothetical protein
MDEAEGARAEAAHWRARAAAAERVYARWRERDRAAHPERHAWRERLAAFAADVAGCTVEGVESGEDLGEFPRTLQIALRRPDGDSLRLYLAVEQFPAAPRLGESPDDFYDELLDLSVGLEVWVADDRHEREADGSGAAPVDALGPIGPGAGHAFVLPAFEPWFDQDEVDRELGEGQEPCAPTDPE